MDREGRPARNVENLAKRSRDFWNVPAKTYGAYKCITDEAQEGVTMLETLDRRVYRSQSHGHSLCKNFSFSIKQTTSLRGAFAFCGHSRTTRGPRLRMDPPGGLVTHNGT